MLRPIFKAIIMLAALLICLMIVASVLSMFSLIAVPVAGAHAISSMARIPGELIGGLGRFAFMVGPVFVLGFLICLGVLALRLLGDHERPESRDESRTLLEVNRSLARMEERIEALETLLLTKRERGSRRSRTPV